MTHELEETYDKILVEVVYWSLRQKWRREKSGLQTKKQKKSDMKHEGNPERLAGKQQSPLLKGREAER